MEKEGKGKGKGEGGRLPFTRRHWYFIFDRKYGRNKTKEKNKVETLNTGEERGEDTLKAQDKKGCQKKKIKIKEKRGKMCLKIDAPQGFLKRKKFKRWMCLSCTFIVKSSKKRG